MPTEAFYNNKMETKKNNEGMFSNEDLGKIFYAGIVIFFGILIGMSINNSPNDCEGGSEIDFCLYKNYTSYSENHCYKELGEVVTESPEVVACNSASGFCFKLVRVVE